MCLFSLGFWHVYLLSRYIVFLVLGHKVISQQLRSLAIEYSSLKSLWHECHSLWQGCSAHLQNCSSCDSSVIWMWLEWPTQASAQGWNWSECGKGHRVSLGIPPVFPSAVSMVLFPDCCLTSGDCCWWLCISGIKRCYFPFSSPLALGRGKLKGGKSFAVNSSAI